MAICRAAAAAAATSEHLGFILTELQFLQRSLSGSEMVSAVATRSSGTAARDQLARAWKAAAAVVDPEIPVLTIADLGVLRDVQIVDGFIEATITPTYSGCPAMNLIALNVEAGAGRSRLRACRGSRPCCRRPGPRTG